MMRTFEKIDPTKIDVDPRVVFCLEEYLKDRLLRDSGLLDLFKQIVSKYQIPYPTVEEAPPPSWN